MRERRGGKTRDRQAGGPMAGTMFFRGLNLYKSCRALEIVSDGANRGNSFTDSFFPVFIQQTLP